jgi:pyruvate/2-oxoglutarate dehydrogenase complex dihydrolipoamide dehydrogenase (E3) component
VLIGVGGGGGGGVWNGVCVQIALGSDGSVVVNEYMETTAAGVFAAGDIADHPCTVTHALTASSASASSASAAAAQARARIEHWNVAQQQARVAAHNMLAAAGGPSPQAKAAAALQRRAFRSIPYFWTMQYGSLRLAGNPRGHTELLVDGSVEEKKFTAYYAKHGVVVAVATMGRDPIVSAAAELLR